MSRQQKSMHIAVVKRPYKGKVYESVLLRRAYREDGKVKNETLANLTALPAEAIEVLRMSLKGETLVPLAASFEIVSSKPQGHVRAVLDAMKRLDIAGLISSTPSRERDIVCGLIAARILAPHTKLATTRWWKSCTLAEELSLADVDADEIYAAMDWLYHRQNRIEKKLAKRHLVEGGTALYDLSSSYMTGSHCELALRGYSRDGKNGTLQVSYGLMTDDQGRPLAVTVYPGNTRDSTTVNQQIDVLRKQFGLDHVVLVGDRGMITKTHIDSFRKDESRGVDWVTALKSPQIRKLFEAGALQLGLFDERNLASIIHPDYPGEQLVACRNPSLAERRRRVREDLIRATAEALDEVRKRVESGSLRGEDSIGVAVGKVVNRYKVAKHFSLTITARSLGYVVNEASVKEEAAIDGLYVIRTSLGEEKASPAEAVRIYKLLTQVERAFRCIKTVDLHVRPIHHWLTDRVSCHVFLCVLAYYVEWHLREAWLRLTFADDDPVAHLAREPVLPSKRSGKARLKIETGRTAEGLEVQSFRTLLENLATLTRNTCRRPGGKATFEIDAIPSELQAAALRQIEAIGNAA